MGSAVKVLFNNAKCYDGIHSRASFNSGFEVIRHRFASQCKWITCKMDAVHEEYFIVPA
jgi:hypothetical protein